MVRSSLPEGTLAPPREVGALKFRWNPTPLIISKRPLDLFNIERIYRTLGWRKDIHFIIIVRDPRSLVSSRHKSVPSDFFQGYDQCYVVSHETISYTNPGIIRTFEAIRKATGDPRVTVISYEDIVNDPDRVQAQLNSLDIPWRGKFSEFYKSDIPKELQRALNGVRKADPTNATSWRTEGSRARRVIQQFTAEPKLFELLEEWKYETNRRWFDDLVAKFGPCISPRGTIVGFYTTGTYYENEAQRLQRSAAKIGLEPLLTGVPTTGSWVRNASMKARFLLEQREAFSGPLLYVDVDAVFHADPWTALMPGEEDMAVYFNREGRLLSGTLLINDTQGARELLERWTAACDAEADEWDQRLLQRIINDDEASGAPRYRLRRLPSSFCWVFDRGESTPYDGQVIIEHLQASRESLREGRSRFRRMSRRLKGRLDRIEAIERELRT
jgi:hypothetical protein